MRFDFRQDIAFHSDGLFVKLYLSELEEDIDMRRTNYRQIITILTTLVIFSGCQSAQFMAQPTNGATVMPDGRMALLSIEGLAISAYKTKTPYGLGDKITTFHTTLINQTDHPIEFIPKQYLLFDQNNRQYLALTKPDLSEAAGMRSRPHGSVAWGFGGGTFHSRSFYHAHYYANPYWDYGRYRQAYQGLLAKALPIHPITIYPHAMTGGNIYFAVSPKSLRNVRLNIVRFSSRPSRETTPRTIPYSIEFDVIK